MTDQEERPPTEKQIKYLGYLLAKASERGNNVLLPYLPIRNLNRQIVSAWIEYLQTLVGEERKPYAGSEKTIVGEEAGEQPSPPAGGAV